MWWAEARPAEGGRTVVVRRDAAGAVSDVLPAGWNARTRVHEYGGTAWLPLPGGGLAFANWADQRVYRLDPGSAEPVPLTPEPAEAAGLRYADPVLGPGGDEIWWVREAHAEGAIRRHLVAVPVAGAAADDPAAVREIAGGSDFLAFPRPVAGRPAGGLDRLGPPADALGRHRAAGRRARPGRHRRRRSRPCSAARTSRCCSRSGPTPTRSTWSATAPAGGTCTGCRPRGGEPEPLCPRAEEFGRPAVAARRGDSYAPLADGRLVVLHGTDTLALGVLDPATGELTDLDLPYTLYGSVGGRRRHRSLTTAAEPGRGGGGARGRPADRHRDRAAPVA